MWPLAVLSTGGSCEWGRGWDGDSQCEKRARPSDHLGHDYPKYQGTGFGTEDGEEISPMNLDLVNQAETASQSHPC